MKVKEGAPIIGKSIRDARFRSLFDAAVVDIRRDLRRMTGHLSHIELRAGDDLMLDAGSDFNALSEVVTSNFTDINPVKAPAKQFMMALQVEKVRVLLIHASHSASPHA